MATTTATNFGLKLYEIAPDANRIIDIDTSELPITIGRSSSANIHIGVIARNVNIPHPNAQKRAAGETVSIAQLISRTQATIFQDEAGKLRIRDGNGNSSQYGIREGQGNKLLRRPWLLGPGAFIKLTPEGGGYRCWLEWPATESGSDAPTLGYSQWQNENLEEELNEQGQAISALKQSLDETKKESKKTNRAQDLRIRNTEKKIARRKILGVVAILGLLLSLGITSEQIQVIVQAVGVISVAVGGGVILQQGEPERE